MQAVEGLPQLRATLGRLAATGQKRALRAGVGGAMTEIAKAARQGVNSSSAPPAVKKAARKTIGRRYKADKGGQPAAKVGFGVGRPSRKKREEARARYESSQPGVGLSSANIHWFTLGTRRRVLKRRAIIPPDEWGDFRVLLPGASTGSIRPMLAGVLPRAAVSAAAAATATAAKRVQEVLAREARKARR